MLTLGFGRISLDYGVQMSKFPVRMPYDALLTEMCGEWRKLNGSELDAAIGMAIVHSVLDGIAPDPTNGLRNISHHLGIEQHVLSRPMNLLFLNGVFNGMISKDRKELKSYNKTVWGYYGGYACGATGPYLTIDDKRSKK